VDYAKNFEHKQSIFHKKTFKAERIFRRKKKTPEFAMLNLTNKKNIIAAQLKKRLCFCSEKTTIFTAIIQVNQCSLASCN